MSKGLLFWVIWIICLVLWLGVNVGGMGGAYGHFAGGGVIEFILFGLLGWAVFGAPVQ
jgi:hypothetical protein